MDTVRISFPITECRLCGHRDWQHVSVLGAKGHYCRTGCATSVQFSVLRIQQEHRRKITSAILFAKGFEPVKIGMAPIESPNK